MSNRIDFFQSEQMDMAIPAMTLSVFVDGRLRSDVVPIEIVRSGWPEFSWARLELHRRLSKGSETWDAETALDCCRAVNICRCYNAAPPDVAVHSLPIFAGEIDNMEKTFGPDGELVSIVTRDFSASMRRITVFGRRVLLPDGKVEMLTSLPTIFNPEGIPNASTTAVCTDGKAHTIFAAESPASRSWRYADVIDYLLGEYVVPGRLTAPGAQQLLALTEHQVVRDLDITGQSLLEALRMCCDRVDLEFKFVPQLGETGPAPAIVFYRHGHGRSVELSCQKPGERLSVSRTNVSALHSNKKLPPVTHRHMGHGDFKVYEATFDLVKAWDGALEDTDYDKFSPLTNPDFYQVRDVYRKWCLNEAGDYTGEPYDQGDPFDFSKIFGTDAYVRGHRRFWPCLTCDKLGKSLGYYLQASFDGGSTWWQYLYAFNNLLDECGIWLSSDQIDLDTWIAAIKGMLKFRITASVISDERLTCSVADGPCNSTMPVVDHLLVLSRQFKYRQVSGQSIFYASSDQALGLPDEVDDTDALYESVRRQAGRTQNVIEQATVRTPYLMLDLEPGDIVRAHPDSRDMPSLRSDSRCVSRIERVSMDIAAQHTDIDIVQARV